MGKGKPRHSHTSNRMYQTTEHALNGKAMTVFRQDGRLVKVIYRDKQYRVPGTTKAFSGIQVVLHFTRKAELGLGNDISQLADVNQLIGSAAATQTTGRKRR